MYQNIQFEKRKKKEV